MNKTRRATLIGALGAVTGTRPCASAVATWRIVTEYPATAIPGEGIAFFADTATRLARGGLLVQPAYDGIRSATMLRAVADHLFEAADAFTGALSAEAPIFQLSALPFLTASTADTARLLAAARPGYVNALSARGLTLLYATPWPASGIWSRTPLSNDAALNGLRIRTYDAASTDVFARAGAAPVQITFADAMPRLRSGELDAVLSSGDGGAGARLWDMLPHFTVLDYASPLSLAFCQTTALDTLGPDTRGQVLQAGSITERRQFEAMATRAAENHGRMRANGVSISSLPGLRAALVRAARPVIDAWLARAGSDGTAALKEYLG